MMRFPSFGVACLSTVASGKCPLQVLVFLMQLCVRAHQMTSQCSAPNDASHRGDNKIEVVIFDDVTHMLSPKRCLSAFASKSSRRINAPTISRSYHSSTFSLNLSVKHEKVPREWWFPAPSHSVTLDATASRRAELEPGSINMMANVRTQNFLKAQSEA